MSAGRRPTEPFTMIPRNIWDDAAFRNLPNNDARLLYFYLRTCAHQTSSGCCKLKDGYVLTDLTMPGSRWTPETLREQKSVLEQAELIATDDETGEVLITGWWRANGPNNQKWLDGARKQCTAIKSEKLRKLAEMALEEWWLSFAPMSPASQVLLSNLGDRRRA